MRIGEHQSAGRSMGASAESIVYQTPDEQWHVMAAGTFHLLPSNVSW